MNTQFDELAEEFLEVGTQQKRADEEIIVNGKPIKVKDIIDTMEYDYRERHGLPDPEE